MLNLESVFSPRHDHWDDQWLPTFQQCHARLPVIDRDALAIWLATYPLLLHNLNPSPAQVNFLQIKGEWRLRGQEDQSHTYLYARQWWGAAKKALRANLGPLAGFTQLDEAIQYLAVQIEAPDGHSLTLAFLVLMTLRQSGTRFLDSEPPVSLPPASEATLLARRQQGPRKSLWSRISGSPPQHLVRFAEAKPDAQFPALEGVEITTAAELDKRPYHLQDPRCYEGMGPIPVDCRSGSCGTCWIGVLGGRENLDPASPFERQRMEYFGYFDAGFGEASSSHPLLRLACQAKIHGPVTLVIPPWNGVFGKSRRQRMDSGNAGATFES